MKNIHNFQIKNTLHSSPDGNGILFCLVFGRDKKDIVDSGTGFQKRRNLGALKNRNNSVVWGMNQDAICAIVTANEVGAIGIIRISGAEAFQISAKILKVKIWRR